jgi:hypothetical protein
MPILNKSAYQSLVNSRFPDNTSNLITPQNVRDMFTDTKDSLSFLFDSATIGSQWIFGVSPAVPEPSNGSDAASKNYVDQNVQGVSPWVQSVIDFFDPTGGLPGSPNTGDRYIASATDNGWTVNNIYEYNGSTWDETVATEGLATWNETTDVFLTYNGAIWVQFGAVVSHNVLAGLQGGTANEYYHLTLAQFNGYIDKNANETIAGSFTFTAPVTGATPTLDDHYATKAYVDANPASVLAGSGLTKNGSTLSLNGEITTSVDNFFTGLEYKLRGVTNGLSVVVDDVNNRVFIGEGASTNLPDDYNSYIGIIGGVPTIKGDLTLASLEVNGPIKYQVNIPTVDTVGRTLDNDDNNSIVRGNGTFTYTLSASGLSSGWTAQVVNEGAGIIDFTSSQTINSEAGTTPSIENQWAGATIYYDGTAFTVIGVIS